MSTVSDKLKGQILVYYVGGYARFGRAVGSVFIALSVVFIFFTSNGGHLFYMVDELVSIGVAVFIIDHLLEKRVKKELRKYINQELEKGRNAQILWAIWKLRRYSDEYKWLFDGSLDGYDFSHSDLYRVNIIREVDLRVNIRYADFIYANFGNANLFNIDFSGSSFQNVQFQHAALSWVKFRNCSFRGASFEGATLAHTDFRGSDVTMTQLTRAKEINQIILPNGQEIMGRNDLYQLITALP
jgi:hypothetical protein